jgi:hypothetical protein
LPGSTNIGAGALPVVWTPANPGSGSGLFISSEALVYANAGAFRPLDVTPLGTGSLTIAATCNFALVPVHLADVVPLRFASSSPLKVVVSQDGTDTGADPGSTQGAAKLYVLTSGPLA